MIMGAVSKLWSMSLQADLLIFAVLTVRFFLKKYPKAYVYFLWMLVGVRLLCPVFVETPFSLQPETILPDGIAQNGGFLSGQEPYSRMSLPDGQGIQTDISGKEGISSGGSDITGAGTGVNGGIPISSEKDIDNMENPDTSNGSRTHDEGIIMRLFHKVFHPEASGFDLSGLNVPGVGVFQEETSGLTEIFGVLVIVYLAGVGVFVCFYLIQYAVMRCRISTAVRGKQNIWFSEKIDSPFVFGIIRPRIIMPYGLKKQEGYQILKHEQTHIRHHDPLIRLIGTLCICLHWWNPPVWLAVFKMNQDMEMYCDEAVLRDASPEEKKSYARTLLSFAEKRSGLSVGLAFGESHTERRVRNLQRKRKGGILITGLVVTIAVFCVVAFMTIPGIDAEGADSAGNTGTEDTVLGHTGNGDLQTGDPGSHANGNITGSAASSVSGTGNISLTEGDKEYLMNICPKIPEFVSEEELKDVTFWREFLFNYYTSDFDRETVDRYVDQWGYEVPCVKVSYDEVQNTVEQIFGKTLSAYLDDMSTLGETSVIYEEDFFYISISDSPAYKYEYVSDTDTDILKEVELLEGLYDDEEYQNRIYLYLLPADNERGFIVSGKERVSVPQNITEGIIEGTSFEVDMNSFGQVTFAAYAPNTSMNPYEDVAFKLIQGEQAVYTFNRSDIGQDKEAWIFQNVAAVAFPDLNGDGYTDVITIVNYKFGEGTPSESTLSEARIFTGRENRYFIEERTLEEEYNNSHEQKTVSDIENFVTRPEYQDYFERTSIYGMWKVTEHIQSAGVYALSEEEIKSLENKHLQYGRYWYKVLSDENAYTVDNYRKESITVEQFEEDFMVDVAAMGFSTTSLDYFELEGVSDSASLFGQFFYQIDADNALIYYEGVFFRAVRE